MGVFSQPLQDMLKRYRKALLFLALATVVALAVFAPTPEVPVGPVTHPAAVQGSKYPAGSPSARVAAKDEGRGTAYVMPNRPVLGDSKADVFGSQSWNPPPKPVIPQASVPVPQPPPPLDYRFAGRLLQDGKVQFFVSKGDTPVAVKLGDNLDGYIVESIVPTAIGLVYPPLGYKQTIVVPPGIPGDGPAVSGMSAVAAPGPAPAAPAPKPKGAVARVHWQGPVRVKLGAPFSITLRVNADQPITASPMQVRYDPAILESVTVRPGKRYAAEAGPEFTYRVNPEGLIEVAANAKSTDGSDPELLVLTFKPRKSGVQAEISLTSLNLQGIAGRPLPHDALASFQASVTP
jgi:hypothetical protein